MTSQKYCLVTGATSGLGLSAVTHMTKIDSSITVIVGARYPSEAEALRQSVSDKQLALLELDTSSLRSVLSFAREVRQLLSNAPLSALALNAGVQIVRGDRFSVDGYELTFATNVLGHIVLFNELRDVLSPSAIVVSTASGTHDKDHKLAKPYKFYGGFFPSADDIAAGRVSQSSDNAQMGRDRYATSKLCNILFTYAMSRHYGGDGPRFIAFDPGLMPGTELARDQPAALRFAWKNVLPTVAKMIDGASTAQKSGKVLAELLLAKRLPIGTGLHVEFTGLEIPSSEISHDQKMQDELIGWVQANVPV